MTSGDGAANELLALAVLRDLVQPLSSMIALELADGPRVVAPAGSAPAAVMWQLAAGSVAVSSQERTAADRPSEEPRHNRPNARSMPSCSHTPSVVKLPRDARVAALDHHRAPVP